MLRTPQTLQRFGNGMMITGILLTSSFGAVAFIMDSLLPMLLQLAGHIGFMISPIFIKVGYVLRLIAHRQTKLAAGQLAGGPAL